MAYIITVFDKWEGSYRPLFNDRDTGEVRLFQTRKEAEETAANYRGSDGRFSRVEVKESAS